MGGLCNNSLDYNCTLKLVGRGLWKYNLYQSTILKSAVVPNK